MKIGNKDCVKTKRSGFTLVEVIVALGIFTFAATALLGVMPVGIQQVQSSTNQNAALSVMEAMRDDILLAAESGANTSPVYQIPLPVGAATTNTTFFITSSGDLEIAIAEANPPAGSVFRVLVEITTTTVGNQDYSAVSLKAGWPASNENFTSGFVELLSSY